MQKSVQAVQALINFPTPLLLFTMFTIVILLSDAKFSFHFFDVCIMSQLLNPSQKLFWAGRTKLSFSGKAGGRRWEPMSEPIADFFLTQPGILGLCRGLRLL